MHQTKIIFPWPGILPGLIALLIFSCGKPEKADATKMPEKIIHKNYKEICYSIRPLLVKSGEVKPDWISRPFVKGLTTTYVIDLQKKVKPVTTRHLDAWKIDADHLHRRMEADFLAMFASGQHEFRFRGTKRENQAVIVHTDQLPKVFYHSSLLLLPDLLLKPLQEIFGAEARLMVAIPNLDRCHFLRADDLVTQNRLRDELIRAFRDDPHPLLDHYLLLDGDGKFTLGPKF